jgi:hypothetical protein
VHSLPYIRQPRLTNKYIFTLRMVTAMFAEMSDSSQYLTQLIPKSQSFTLNASHKIPELKNKSYCEISVPHNGEYEDDCLLDVAPCSLIEIYRCFRGV